MIPLKISSQPGLDNSPTTPLVDWPIFFVESTPNVHGGFIDKKYVSKYMKISKIGAMLRSLFLTGFAGQGVLNKDPTVWLDGAMPPPNYIIGQYNNTFGGLANLLLGNTPKVHGGFIDIPCHVGESLFRGMHLSAESYTHCFFSEAGKHRRSYCRRTFCRLSLTSHSSANDANVA